MEILMKNIQRWIGGSLMVMAMGGCANLQAANEDGPGMVATYAGYVKGISPSIKEIRLPSGKLLGNPGSVGYDTNPLHGGATEGFAPDGRQLPEWVEFQWQDMRYPGKHPEDFKTYEEWSAYVSNLYSSTPIKTERVMVRGRIPQAVIDEVMEAKRTRVYGKLPDKKIWVYFIWTVSGVKFRWRLWDTSDHPRQSELSGGDEIDGS
jgi:hypothetical protein